MFKKDPRTSGKKTDKRLFVQYVFAKFAAIIISTDTK